MTDLPDEAIEVHTKFRGRMPNPSGAMQIYSLNGAIQDVGPHDTAYSFRDAKFVHVILVTDDDPSRMPDHIGYARDYWNALHPFSTGAAYVNFLMDEGSDRVQATYRDNYPKLQAIKANVDPKNRFSSTQNIVPKA